MTIDKTPPLVQMIGISKRFPGVLALDGVEFDLLPGEIHALMGENGAGKSSLIRVLTGAVQPDAGRIVLSGSPISPRSPADAAKLGIGVVYQEVNLLPNLSVGENVMLGHEPRSRWGIDWRKLHAAAGDALENLGVKVSTRANLGTLPLSIQQLVAIARAVRLKSTVLVLDEPTSSLDRAEVETLFALLTKLRNEKMGVVFVTHFIEQMYRISDRVTVLRNGKKIGTNTVSELDRGELVSQMLGRSIGERGTTARLRQKKEEKPVLQARGLSARGQVEDVAFDLRKGEILGFVGLLGSGRSEAIRMMFGIDPIESGQLFIRGKRISRPSPRRMVRLRMGLCPEDRRREAIFPNLSLRDNILMTLLGRGTRISKRKKAEIVERYRQLMRISAAGLDTPIWQLSGGNQQKAVLARWLAADPEILLLDEPTRGIDIGAKFEILGLLASLAEKDLALVFVSSELEESARICSRALVFRDRKMEGELQGEAVNEADMLKRIAGASS
jgi:simple sugar transport system ATP-binding protein